MNRIRLKHLRTLYGFSLRELATEIGFAFTFLDQMERGIRPISKENEQSILDAMYRLNTTKTNLKEKKP